MQTIIKSILETLSECFTDSSTDKKEKIEDSETDDTLQESICSPPEYGFVNNVSPSHISIQDLSTSASVVFKGGESLTFMSKEEDSLPVASEINTKDKFKIIDDYSSEDGGNENIRGFSSGSCPNIYYSRYSDNSPANFTSDSPINNTVRMEPKYSLAASLPPCYGYQISQRQVTTTSNKWDDSWVLS